jgi:hypothetical protein
MIDETIIWKQRILSPVEKLLAKIAQKVSDWFPPFVQVKKNEIEILFKSEIENFKTEIENEYKNELEQNRIQIKQLNNIIIENEKTINSLEIQIKIKNESDSERAKYIDKNKYQTTSKNQINLVQESSEPLLFTVDDYTREQLEKLTMTALKNKAKELKIPKYSSYKTNTDLINEILKHKSK